MKKIILLFLISGSIVFCQSKNADEIINNVKSAFDKVQNYVVDITIKTDIKFIKVPEMKAKIYFKQPDKIHFESKGFALLPKNGMFTSPMSFLNDDYTAVFVKFVDFEGYKTSIVKVIPLNDKGNLILTTLWIDQSRNIIRKVEATTKTNGTFSLELNYDGKTDYPLPSSMVLTLDVPDFKSARERHRGLNQNREKNSSNMTKGKIYIYYSNYVVNKGVPDSLFEKKNDNPLGE